MREIMIETKRCYLCGILQVMHRNEICLVNISPGGEMILHYYSVFVEEG